MPSTGLQGPFALTTTNVDQVVTKTSPGAYALGAVNSAGTFIVSYVGRSDADLRGRLKTHAAAGNYTKFKCDYFPSAKSAFEKECGLYHDFGETDLDNKVHPARPANSTWTCPRCKTFG